MRTVVAACCLVFLLVSSVGVFASECGPDVRAPIWINGDHEFTAENGVTGGTGTPNDPFVITSVRIDAGPCDYGIRIERTSSYFEIRDVEISGAAKAGIYLSYTENGAVLGCRLVANWTGIVINFGSSNRVSDCSFESNTDAIHAYFSHDNEVVGNRFSENRTALWFDACHENAVTANDFVDNHTAVFLDLGSSGNILSENAFLENLHHAQAATPNQWSCGDVGNYWDTYAGLDIDKDGVGDTPFVIQIQDNEDDRPMMSNPRISD
ncbi:right-handed parallel beta-helix repeat-containing protein [Candidatus Bipolaricaulota bacterium]|nr:right-handed parallel beta-helix repeat-containing protein [Candidatus Bipolaricaulota bacterium]